MYEVNAKKILNILKDIIVIYDIETKKIKYVNESFLKFFDEGFNYYNENGRDISNNFINKKNYLTNNLNTQMFWIDYILNNPYKEHKILMQNNEGYYHHFNLYVKVIDKKEYMVTFNNITKTNSIQEELRTEKSLLKDYKRIVDLSSIITKTDPKGSITYVNDKFCDISGFTKEELIGKNHNIVRHPDTSDEVISDLWKTIKGGSIWSGELKNKTKNGDYYIVDSVIAPILSEDGDVLEYISIRKEKTKEYKLAKELIKINEKFKKENEQLQELTKRDSLTNSYNRRGLDELLEKDIQKHIEENKELCLVMCDIDYFKKINDNFGHDIGDKVLYESVTMIRNNLKKKDILARYGGEEFVIVLSDTKKEDAIKVVNNLKKIINNTIIEDINKNITFSFGISSLSEAKSKIDGLELLLEEKDKKSKLKTKIDELMMFLTKISDIRLYEAKKQGRNRIIYD